MRITGRINSQWETPLGNNFKWEHVIVEVLMDVRAELVRLNALLHCQNFTDIPHKLERIKRNTAKKRKPKAAAKPKLRVVR